MRLRSILFGLLLIPVAALAADVGNEVYAARRAKLLAQLPKGAIAFLHSAPAKSDRHVYHPDSSFWYMTGIGETETAVMLRPDAPEGERYTVFNMPKDWSAEQWTGYRVGQEQAKERYGAQAAFKYEELGKQLPDLMRNASSLWILDGGDSAFRQKLVSAWDRRAGNGAIALPVYNLAPVVSEMRLFKEPGEIALLREAANLSVKAHLVGMPLAQAGKGEWTVRAAMEAICSAAGSPFMAYSSIVGSGENSVVLHYDAADKVMKPGEMIVNDSGCEYALYASDVTRSYPVGGKFTPEQKAIYEVVQAAQEAGIAKAKLGAPLHEAHDATVEVIVDGLLKLGIMKGKREEILAKKTYRTFYPHGSSHWLGLDVHDAGNYESSTPDKSIPEKERRYYIKSLVKLKPGMAFTIEPGIYVPANAEGVDKKWWNIGVRIEDDFLMTEKGVECLTCALPRDIPSIEAAMRGAPN